MHLFLPPFLKYLLQLELETEAIFFAKNYQDLPYFEHALEILVHETLEMEGEAKILPLGKSKEDWREGDRDIFETAHFSPFSKLPLISPSDWDLTSTISRPTTSAHHFIFETLSTFFGCHCQMCKENRSSLLGVSLSYYQIYYDMES